MEKDKTEKNTENKNREQDREELGSWKEYGSGSGNKSGHGEKADSKNEELHRITISKQAERALSAVVERINEGFIGGKVNRTQVANWILARFNDMMTETEIKEIRMEYFDEVAMLESILRQAKETGRVPTEFKGLLQRQLGMDELPKRRTKRSLTEDIINDDIK